MAQAALYPSGSQHLPHHAHESSFSSPPTNIYPDHTGSKSAIEQQQVALHAYHSSEKDSATWKALTGRDDDAQAHVVEGKLVVSPYTTPDHLLDLSAVSPSCRHLAQALAGLRAVREDYATAPYLESFNWPEVVENLRASLTTDKTYRWQDQGFYIVVFRSQIPPTTDRSHLGALDEVSHAEAMAGGGLLKYWFGIPDATGRNLATCVWRDYEDSKRGSAGKGHRQAAKETRVLYTEWKIDRLRLQVDEDAKAWSIVDWID